MLWSSPARAQTQGASPARDAPPHIVLVMVDDLGWLDHSLAIEGAGPPSERPFRTPHLERLAREGTLFERAYASAPVCSPTRVSLMTGQHPARHGVTYWTLYGGRDTSAAHPRLAPPPWRSDSLQPGDVTLPGLLREAGYHTIHVGKAHYGAKGTPGADPRALGFDVNIGGHAAGGPGSFLGTENFSASKRTPGGDTVWDIPGLAAYHGQDVFLTDALAAEAARALEAGLAGERPVFLQFAPYAVHAPITANERCADRVPEGLDPRERAYATMVASVDDALGTLLDVLDRTGARERTLIVYTSDNGGLSAVGRGGEPHTHNAPASSGKGAALQGGLLVPLIVSGPGVPAGRRIARIAPVTHDLFPTLLEVAGGVAPKGHAVDGISRWGLFQGGAEPTPEALGAEVHWWHMPHAWGPKGPGIEPFSALERGGYKLVHYHDGGPAPEATTTESGDSNVAAGSAGLGTPPAYDPRVGRLVLYDLVHDFSERRDLLADPSAPDAAASRVIARGLAVELATRQREALVGVSRVKGDGEPVLDAHAAFAARFGD